MAGKSNQRGGRSGGPGRSGGGRQSRGRSKRPATNRHYPRTARLNTLIQEIVADYFERADDERFEMLTVTGVEVDNDMNRAQVFVTEIGFVADRGDVADDDVDPDSELLGALADHRKPVQGKIAREARMRKTPEVVFAVDPGARAGARIEHILASIDGGDVSDPDSDTGPETGDVDSDDAPAGEAG